MMSKRGRDIHERLLGLYYLFCILWTCVVFCFSTMSYVLCFCVDMWDFGLFMAWVTLFMASIFVISIAYVYGWLTCVSFPYTIYLCLSISLIYACVEGELHLKSPPKIFVITIYVLSSSKRGRLLAQRPLARYFDDNKTYLVMFLTILFKRISGLKQVDLTAPHQDSQFGRR